MDTPHYLRFARTLALATTIALPACSGADAPAATDGEGHAMGPVATGSGGAAGGGGHAAAAPIEVTTAISIAQGMDMDASAGDASQGHSSGPLPPPEMPASIG